jgi:Family of unknown function (DUF5989)
MGALLMELWAFMREWKTFWVLPMITTLLLLASLIVFTQGSVVAVDHLGLPLSATQNNYLSR